MAPAVLKLLRVSTKLLVAGGALYVVYDYGLLGSGTQGQEVLKKSAAALPPAVQEWAEYCGVQIPSAPKLDFSVCESWNWGVQKSVSALSVAPTKACDYTAQGWKYVKDSVK